MSIAEVKEGEKNHEIGKLATFYRQSGCEHFKQIVTETETAHTVKQFDRMLRLMDRMDFATNVLGKGHGRDPDSDQAGTRLSGRASRRAHFRPIRPCKASR
jgi:hypothetical protein